MTQEKDDMPTKDQKEALNELAKQGQEWCDYDPVNPALFESGDRVTHKKGGEYVILKAPDRRRLEHCNEPFYEYVRIKDNAVWIRRQSEMEDGRFTKTK